VGSLDDRVTEEVLQNVFIPFGEIISILLPRHENGSGAHRGFAFVEFEDAADAQAAIDNVHDSELFGRVLTCNLANARSAKHQSVWADADAWMGKTLAHSAADVDVEMRHAGHAAAAPTGGEPMTAGDD
jgi:peptidyl-prolyl isomerase E (cyclophilin E)